MMTWLLPLLYFTLFTALAEAQDIPIPERYAQQNQHISFLVSQENSLIVECSLALVDQRCDFEFISKNQDPFKLRISYHLLGSIHAPLLESLKRLQRSWGERYPVGPLRNMIFLTRQNDAEALSQLISELESEALPLRVLIQSHNTRELSAYIYSRHKAQEIFMMFQYHILRGEQGHCRTGCDKLLTMNPVLLNSLVSGL